MKFAEFVSSVRGELGKAIESEQGARVKSSALVEIEPGDIVVSFPWLVDTAKKLSEADVSTLSDEEVAYMTVDFPALLFMPVSTSSQDYAEWAEKHDDFEINGVYTVRVALYTYLRVELMHEVSQFMLRQAGALSLFPGLRAKGTPVSAEEVLIKTATGK